MFISYLIMGYKDLKLYKLTIKNVKIGMLELFVIEKILNW